MANRPRKNPLDVGGNPENVTLRLGWLRLGRVIPATSGIFYHGVCLMVINGDGGASAEVCALLSAILIVIVIRLV